VGGWVVVFLLKKRKNGEEGWVMHAGSGVDMDGYGWMNGWMDGMTGKKLRLDRRSYDVDR
jgi:hypothetical protein